MHGFDAAIGGARRGRRAVPGQGARLLLRSEHHRWELGFTDADRIRRVGEVCGLMAQAGLVVTAAFIFPFRAERRVVRDLFDHSTFFEIFVDAPLEVAAARDPKGL